MKKLIQLLTCGVLLLSAVPAWADGPSQLEFHQQQAVESALDGCTRAMEDGAIAAYMKRRESAGHPVANAAKAKIEIESIPQWKESLLPQMQSTCECLFKTSITEMRSSSSEAELAGAISRMKEVSVSDLDGRASTCLAGSSTGG